MPAQRLPWIKFWPEAVEHEKFAALTPGESWSWVVVWAKASVQPTRWRFASVQHAHHVTGISAKIIRRLVEVRLLDEGPDGLVIHDAKHWQDAANIPPTQREHSTKGDRTVSERAAKGDLEGEGDREGDLDVPPNSAELVPPKGQRRAEVDDAFKALIEDEFWEQCGSRGAVQDSIAMALSYKKRANYSDQRAFLRNWVRHDAERSAAGHRPNARPAPTPIARDSRPIVPADSPFLKLQGAS